MNYETYDIDKKDSPIIALALHDGHFIPSDILSYINLQEHERFREEDPYTAFMIDLPVNKVCVNTSRFMVDFNRLEDKAIYKNPEDAWGLKVWKNEFPTNIEQGLMDYYHGFYAEMGEIIEELIDKFGYFIILDIHSYNHRRDSPDKSADQIGHPEINIGSAYNHTKWQSITHYFMDYLSQCSIAGKQPDVRENIIFKGGGFSQWVNQRYADKGCVISIEFKKTFMDEWTGRAFINHILDIREVLLQSVPILTNELKRVMNKS